MGGREEGSGGVLDDGVVMQCGGGVRAVSRIFTAWSGGLDDDC